MFYYWYSDLCSFAPDKSDFKDLLCWYKPAGSNHPVKFYFDYSEHGNVKSLSAYRYLIDYTYNFLSMK